MLRVAGNYDIPAPQSTRPTHAHYWVLGWLCLAATIAYVSRNSISAAESTIRSELQLSVQQMGWVLSAFFWCYALAQIPTGWIGQRWGTRRALALYAIVWSLATAITGLSTGLVSLLLARLLFGVAQAGIFPCSANTIARWIPTSRRAVAGGALGSFMSIGGAAGAALTGVLISVVVWPSKDDGGAALVLLPALSWRWIFALFALPGLAWAVGFYWWFRDEPDQHPGVNSLELKQIRAEQPPPRKPGPTPWLTILNSVDMWLVCGQQFFRAAAYVIFATWFPTYLQEARGVSTSMSGLLTSLPLFSYVVGGLLGGLIVDWLWQRTRDRRISRQAVAVVAMLVGGLFLIAAYFVEATLPSVTLIAVGSLSAALAGSCGYTVTIDKSGEFVGPIFGAMNMAGNFGAALCPIVIAYVANQGAGASSGDWDSVMLVFAAIMLASAICWMLINPNGTFLDSRES